MCTETKDARVHCTILNDHTNRHPTTPTGEAGERSPLETTTKPPTGGRVVLSGPNSVLPNPKVGSLVIPHFSSNPLPPPTTESEDSRARGGTEALHHQPQRAQNTRL